MNAKCRKACNVFRLSIVATIDRETQIDESSRQERMLKMDKVLEIYEHILHALAKVTVHTLEIVGISIVIIGAFKVLLYYFKRMKNKDHEYQNTVIALGRSLGLALEFKMGAEIVNTVIVRELKELLILGIVIALRAVLAVLIHWEITTEEKEERAHMLAKEQASAQEKEQESGED